MKYYSCTLRLIDTKSELNACTFAVPAVSFTEAADKVDLFISGMQAIAASKVEIVRLSQITRTLKQSILDGANIAWHKE